MMKITFRGWKREVKPHDRELSPVNEEGGEYTSGVKGNPLKWHSANCAYAKIKALALTGDFLMELCCEEEELESWFTEFTKAQPERALRLLCRLQAEATIALAEKEKGNPGSSVVMKRARGAD